jgi:hypothetical protein
VAHRRCEQRRETLSGTSPIAEIEAASVGGLVILQTLPVPAAALLTDVIPGTRRGPGRRQTQADREESRQGALEKIALDKSSANIAYGKNAID